MFEQRDKWIGQQLNAYRLERFLGRGSFGDVYLGEDVRDKSLAAVKILHMHLTDLKDVQSFLQEARMMRFTHPNIVQVLDFGITQDGIPFIAMEYAPNGTLRHLHPRYSCLPLATIVPYIEQIARGLQFVHAKGLTHRDVKPENLLIGSNGNVLLSDFGIATESYSPDSVKTPDRTGTIYYMAPEQIQTKAIPASDQYALGVVTYEWLCGIGPFNGSSREILVQHLIKPPPPLCEKVPGLSRDVEQVVLKALAKDPKDRFVDISTFARALEEASSPKVPRGTTLTIYNDQKDEIRAVAWSPDGQYLASGSADGTVQVWQPIWKRALIARTEYTTTYQGHKKGINAVAWSPDGQRIASASLDRTVQVWDAVTSERRLCHKGHASWIRVVAWSPDGKLLASGAGDEMVQVWDAETQKLFLKYSEHVGEVRSLAWSPTGKYLLSGSTDKTVRLWDARTGETLITYTDHTKSINAVAWSPDGRRVASGSLDATIQVWDAMTGKKLLTYCGHTVGVNAVAWSPDGQYIASGGRDNLVHIWDAASGDHVYTYSAHTDWLMALSWSPNGNCLTSGSADKTVHIWRAR